MQIVCQEVAQEMRVCSLGAGLQEQAPKHPKLRRLRAGVVSVGEKAWQKTVSGEDQGDERKRITDEVSKYQRWRQNWGACRSPG